MNSLVVWDYHGVLEKGAEESVQKILNTSLIVHKYNERFTEDDINKLYGKKVIEYFKDLMPEENEKIHLELALTFYQISSLNPWITEKFIRRNDYVIGVLDKIPNKILISNTNIKTVKWFVGLIGLESYFKEDNTFGVDSFKTHGVTKPGVLRDYLKDKYFDKVIIIDDSEIGKELKKVSKDSGFQTVFFLYRHQGRNFIECDSDYNIHDLREVLKEL
jgi:hypothetical protein